MQALQISASSNKHFNNQLNKALIELNEQGFEVIDVKYSAYGLQSSALILYK